MSAIDAAVALADDHGSFRQTGHDVEYLPNTGTDEFSMTMFSRKGVLPEADFYHPIPYEPLAICTLDAIEKLIDESDQASLLAEAFELFREELTRADREYAEALSLQTASLEEFCTGYFERRCRLDPFEWARRNLDEAVLNAKREFTVKWRYAILRMHEVFGQLAPHFSDDDFSRFDDTLKAVFVDNYATVPHDSIRRLLALNAAGKLAVSQLEEGAQLDSWSEGRGATMVMGNRGMHFPAFIEATGQKISSAKEFPFPSLLRQGVIQDVTVEGDGAPKRGIAIDGAYHPISALQNSHRLFCLSLPFLLGQHPFAQGITSSAEMADVVCEAIQNAERQRSFKTPSAKCATS